MSDQLPYLEANTNNLIPMKPFVLSVLCACLFAVSSFAQPYTFEIDSATYTPVDTTKQAPSIRGSSPWANGWISSKIDLPFEILFFSANREEIYYDSKGSISFENGGRGVNSGRIEVFNNGYLLKNNSYILHKIETGKDAHFLMEYSNCYLENDTSIYLNFQCKVYQEGTIEIIMGPHNLHSKLPVLDAFFTGVDSNDFAWSYFLSGDPQQPIPKEKNLQASLRELPKAGTIYRFKNRKSTSLTPPSIPEIAVFPNPFTSSVSIDLEMNEAGLDLEITNLQGKVVWRQFGVKDRTFQLGHLPPGSYMLRVSSNHRRVGRQVLVKN